MENRPTRIIWHHTAVGGTKPQASAVNAYHKAKKFPISTLGFHGGYHILIEKDGSPMRYRLDNEIGAHTFGENQNSLGICMAGNFDVETPTKEQEISLARQLSEWVLKWSIPIEDINPHRYYKATDCPGKLLADDWARQILQESQPNNLKKTLVDILKNAIEQINAA